ncbi:unnamed protein product [Lymnaea stagnalis]|uniref:PARP n=1 Tax=Lymnaea stagnalis TaxID=6523 RepID=A0AAV2H018_LYMST
MGRGSLMLIAGFPGGTNVHMLVDLLQKFFKKEDLKNVWLDPYREPRAVAFFQHDIDETRLSVLRKQELLKLEDDVLTIKIVKPTWSIFVRTYGAVTFGAIDKLALLMNKKPDRTVNEQRELDDHCFEISFEQGWDAVMEVCKKEWHLEGKKLTVCPYFDCFKEPVPDQFDRVLVQDQLEESVSQTESPSNSSSTSLFHLEKSQNSNKSMNSQQNGKELICFQHAFVPFLLELLHFNQALGEHGCHFTSHIDCEEENYEIEGPITTIKRISKMLKREEDKIRLSETRNIFSASKKVWKELKQHLEPAKCFIVQSEASNDMSLHVSMNNKKISFQDYLKSLIIEKICKPVPSTSIRNSKVWKTFTTSFNSEHSMCQVLVRDDLNVILLALPNMISHLEILCTTINVAIDEMTLSEQNNANVEDNLTAQDRLSVTELDDSVDQTKETMGFLRVENAEDTFSIILKNNFFAWLLHMLNFKAAIENNHSELLLEIGFNEKEFVVTMSEANQGMKSTVLALENKIHFSDEEEDFLKTGVVGQYLESIIRESAWRVLHVDTRNNQMTIQNSKGEKKTLEEFASSFLKRRSVAHVTVKTDDWIHFVEDFHDNNPLYHITIDVSQVSLITVCPNYEVLEEKAKSVFEVVKMNTDLDVSEELNFREIQGIHKVEPEKKVDFTFPIAQVEYEYCKKFMMAKLKIIKEKYARENAFIELRSGGLYVKCAPKMMAEIQNEWQQLIKVQHEDTYLAFPGLVPFMKTNDGKKLVDKISETWKCLIEFPGLYSNQLQCQKVETLERDLVRSDYKTVLLQTAKCNCFQVHLVEGHMENINSNMKVEFHASKSEKSEIRVMGSTSHICVSLPEWKVPEGKPKFTHLRQLRQNLIETIDLVLRQVIYLECKKLAFSTQNMHQCEYPFPLDCLADILTKALRDSLLSEDPDLYASKTSVEFDVFICEPKCEAVFKAFTYFAKNLSTSFGPPDQDVWDNLCAPNVSKYPDYKKYPVIVDVTTHCPSEVPRATLFCYPISPSLEAATCPVSWEPVVSKKLLDESIKDILKLEPDGLLLSHHSPVRCFHFPRDVIVYCSPEWGPGCSNIIYNSLAKCLSLSADMEAVYIVPPGLPMPTLPAYQKYPKKYLGQALFEALDQLFEERRIHRQKKIVFVVADMKYREVFKKELFNRSPQHPEKLNESNFFSWISFKNLWPTWSAPLEKKDLKSDLPYIKTQAPRVPVTLYCHSSMDNIGRAAATLNDEWNALMSQYSETVHLNREQTMSFEKLIMDMPESTVSILLEKHFEEENAVNDSDGSTHSRTENKNKQHNKNLQQHGNKENRNTNPKVLLKGATLKINGLCATYVSDFKSMLSDNICEKPSSVIDETIISDEESFSDLGSNEDSGSSTFQNQGSSVDSVIDPKRDCDQAKDFVASKKSPVFEWKYESEAASHRGSTFVSFETSIAAILEKAYIEENKDCLVEREKIKKISFTKMQGTIHDKKRKIIRSEILASQELDLVKDPKTWKEMKTDCETFEIEKGSNEFYPIQERLLKDLETPTHRVNIIKIVRIQNTYLYQRFRTKAKQLNCPSTTMWHRVPTDTWLDVCHYGFHPAFSATINKKDLGDGVLFHLNAKRCLKAKDLNESKPLCLISAIVCRGRGGLGRSKLRTPATDVNTGQPWDSAIQGEDCMIFSDAQAYPCHSVIFRMENK